MAWKGSYSKVDAYIHCPRKYKYRYIDKLVPRRKAAPLALGSCMAAGIAEYRATGDREQAERAFLQTWVEEGQILPEKIEDDPRRSVQRALQILEEYAHFYPNDPKDMVRSEVSFEEEIADGIIWRGRLDGVIDTPQGLAVVEDKTTSMLGEYYFKKLRSSYQIRWYLWVARHMGLFKIRNGGHAPMCMVNVTYIHPKKFDFQRDLIIKTDHDVNAGYDQLMFWVNQILWATEHDHFPEADSDECLKFGGCEYLPLKGMSGKGREALLRGHYMIEGEQE